MKVVSWLAAIGRADVPMRELDRLRVTGIDAYDLMDQMPLGPARLAAWNAFVFQTYADKLVAASPSPGYIRPDTAQIVQQLYLSVAPCVDRAREAAASEVACQPVPIPRWHTPVRFREELAGMRDTLDTLRTHLGSDLESFETDELSATGLREILAIINAKYEVEGLWLPRPPPELRGRIGDLLTDGIDKAYEMGQLLADPKRLEQHRYKFLP